MHPDAEARIFSLAQPLEEPDRTAFMKAAAEAVEKLGAQADGPGAVHRLLAGLMRPYFHPPVLTQRTGWAQERGGNDRGGGPAPRRPRAAPTLKPERLNLPPRYTCGQTAIAVTKAHPGAANKALLERFPAIDAATFSQARAIVRYAPELVDQVLAPAPRGISFAAAVREASLGGPGVIVESVPNPTLRNWVGGGRSQALPSRRRTEVRPMLSCLAMADLLSPLRARSRISCVFAAILAGLSCGRPSLRALV